MASDSDFPYPDCAPSPAGPALPDVPALALATGHAVLVTPDGEVREIGRAEAGAAIASEPLMVCHTGFLAQRLGRPRPVRRASLYDLTELFAFVCPARFCLPTAAGLAEALDLDPPESPEDEAVALVAAAHALLTRLGQADYPHKDRAAAVAATMGKAGWAWAPYVTAVLGTPPGSQTLGGLDVWSRLPEWEDRAPQGGRQSDPLPEAAVIDRLTGLLGADQALRPGQDRYAATVAQSFTPRDTPGEPPVVLAEAGTGIGKTLGYLAPASLWAEKNGPGTWVSTFTKNLQRQIDQELSRVYPDPLDKSRRAVIRKGRENYLCLLNFEDAARRAASGAGEDAVALGLVARWLEASRDGDMVGGDFPSWLTAPGLVHGSPGTPGLTDRRGECIYAACPHYRKCTIERAVRKARHAHLVVANHALVMHQAALDRALATVRGEENDQGAERRLRLVFDEGHHLFDAADAAFGATLSAAEAAELRRWIRGPEGRARRGRGLPERIGDLTGGEDAVDQALLDAVDAARSLPQEGWAMRGQEGGARGPAEAFFTLVRRHVEARAATPDSPQFGLESDIHPVPDDLLDAAGRLSAALDDLAVPLGRLSEGLRARLDDEAADLDTPTRLRIEATTRGLDRRAHLTIPAWRAMLATLASATPEAYVDWFALERSAGRVYDIAMHRRHVDPMAAFVDAVVRPAHGVLITSATLRDEGDDGDAAAAAEDADRPQEDDSWASADIRTGARHLAPALLTRASIASPFDYKAQTRVIVVRDLAQNAMDQLAAAYRELFKAAGGGAMGLFTAIRRLRAVHDRIAEPLEAGGLPLYAQHVDAMDPATLVDIFRAETNACLLGTNALRDGVDVPGESLRLIVFDRVPWPRPDILHKARRAHFGGRTYDDALTRLRLKQAYGRLVRGPGDRGVFVMLDSRLPSRLATAFPAGLAIERMGLAEAVAAVRETVGPSPVAAGPPAPLAGTAAIA